MTSDLWQETLRHLDEGNFTALEEMLDGPDRFDEQIIKWYASGRFDDQPEALADAVTQALGLVAEAGHAASDACATGLPPAAR